MDGGRICAAVSRWFWIIGLLMLLASLLFFHSTNAIVIIVLVLVAAFFRFRTTFRPQNREEMLKYYNLPLSSRLTMAAMYLGIIAALLLGYWDASERLRFLTRS